MQYIILLYTFFYRSSYCGKDYFPQRRHIVIDIRTCPERRVVINFFSVVRLPWSTLDLLKHHSSPKQTAIRFFHSIYLHALCRKEGLKLVAEELAIALTITFQQSYDLSSIPKGWNSAIATPIYKKGLKSDRSNY